MRARYLVATAMFTLGACQCLTTVRDDGGEGGGGATGGGAATGGGSGGGGGSVSGGGTGGGGVATGGGSATGGGAASGGGSATGGGSQDGGFTDGGCDTYLDCMGSEASVGFCQGVEGGSSYSCINHSCVWECHGHRDCTDDGGCEICTTPVSSACGQTGCTPMTRSCTGTVEQSSCGTFLNESITTTLDANCGTEIDFCDGGTFGTLTEYDVNHASGVFTPFGFCTAEQLPTGAIRWVLNCPGCQLVVTF